MILLQSVKQIFFVLVLLISFNIAQAQTLVSSTYLGNQSEASLENLYGFDFKNGIEMHRVLYTTLDIQGVPDTASGLLIVPDDPTFVYPLLVYQHGTVNSRWDVPSQLAGGYEIAAVFGGQGYATVAPDFLGMGTARGLHPYVHADSEASAAIDLLFAARQYAAENDDLEVNNQVFVTGYSQGGHAAMAAHRSLELDYPNDFDVAASAPMSGPYSVSRKMIDFTLSDQPYGFVAYIAWTALSYNLAYGNLFAQVDEFFKPNYATYVEQFRDEEITLNQLNSALTNELLADVGTVTPRDMIQPAVLDDILNDPTSDVGMALADNDLHDWVPQSPTRILYCTADDQVYYQNATFTDSIMNANGAPDVLSVDMDPTADHGGCVTPAVTFAVLFFNNFQELTVATQELTGNIDDPFLVAPNPTRDELVIQGVGEQAVSRVGLYDVHGQLVLQKDWDGTDIINLDVSELNTGLYFIWIDGANGSNYSKKVMIR